jgi:hypothetical protein
LQTANCNTSCCTSPTVFFIECVCCGVQSPHSSVSGMALNVLVVVCQTSLGARALLSCLAASSSASPSSASGSLPSQLPLVVVLRALRTEFEAAPLGSFLVDERSTVVELIVMQRPIPRCFLSYCFVVCCARVVWSQVVMMEPKTHAPQMRKQNTRARTKRWLRV